MKEMKERRTTATRREGSGVNVLPCGHKVCVMVMEQEEKEGGTLTLVPGLEELVASDSATTITANTIGKQEDEGDLGELPLC